MDGRHDYVDAELIAAALRSIGCRNSPRPICMVRDASMCAGLFPTWFVFARRSGIARPVHARGKFLCMVHT